MSDISIVLPFHRSHGFLAEAIESVTGQSGQHDWELLLVSDGAGPKDLSIAARYARDDRRIHLLSHPDRKRHGASAARNLALKKASGSLVAFLDADDVWLSDKLELQVAILAAHPKAAIVYGPAWRWWSWNGGVDVFVPVKIDGYCIDSVVPGDAVLRSILRDETQVPCIGSVMIRRAALMACDGFDESFEGAYDDQVLYAKLSRRESFYVSSQCVSRYRQHPHSCCARAEFEGRCSANRGIFLNWLARSQGQPALELVGAGH